MSSSMEDSTNRHCLRRLLNRHEYRSSDTEAIYRLHTYPAEYGCLRSLVILMIIVNISISVVNFVFVWRISVENIANIILCIFFVLLLIFLHTRYMSLRHLATVSFIVVLLCLCFAAISFPINYETKTQRKQILPPAEGVWRLAYVIFVLYSFVPLRIYVSLVVGFLLPLAHSLTSIFIVGGNGSNANALLWRQITANIVIFLTVNIVGLFCYDRKEKIRRRLFDAIRASVFEQLRIQDDNDKMERLLLCILPPHVAFEMKADLRQPHLREIFPKTYMQRHDCVSIIFANIVGLTSLSSQCSVHGLVQLLNELFGRFDQLVLENHCLRLQMLGPCYYAVCGLPDPRPDHAKCCIELALDMIDVITFLRDSTEASVQLRAGVHTGRVLSGVIGVRRWKYDIWSEDVEIAQYTEQAGLPGRIHVTQATVDHLQGEFPTEPGNGDERSSQLRAKGIKTYLIVADLPRKRYGAASKSLTGFQRPQGRLSMKNIGDLLAAVKFNVDLPFSNVIQENDTASQKGCNEDGLEKQTSPSRYEEVVDAGRMNENLTQVISNKTIEKTKRQMINYVTLCFKSSTKERKFRGLEDRSYPTSVLCSLVLLVLSMAVQVIVLPRTLLLIVLFVLSFTWISILLIVILGYRIKCIKCDLRKQPHLRRIFSLITILFVFGLSLTNVLCCRDGLLFPGSGSLSGHEMAITFNSDYLLECDVPHYIYLAAIITLVVVALYLKMAALVKLVIWLVMTGAYLVVIEFVDRSIFLKSDSKLNPEVPTDVSGILMFAHFLLALYISSRDFEWTLRLRFLWNHQVSQQRHELQDVQEANRLLILNLLPDHVTPHFQDAVKDLYSQSHGQVAVSFLSVVNLIQLDRLLDGTNKLECLRVLNDIITAIDKLMDDERYKAVCKVKSFGTGYLVVVGLQNTSKIEDMDDWRRHQYLTIMIEFIFDVMEAVAQRDASLMLRAGVSFGPVIAGVVGSKRPQYDIWGETVSMANQLEKTGLPNCIQVTEKIQEILQTNYQFHRHGQFNAPDKFSVTTYFLSGRNANNRSVITMNHQPPSINNAPTMYLNHEPSPAAAAVGGPMTALVSVQQQSESSYEFSSSSSAVSSAKEFPRPGLNPEILEHLPPVAFQLERNFSQITKTSMTPPSSLGRRRTGGDDYDTDGHKKTPSRLPFNFLSAPAGNAMADGQRSPDLPIIHYRNRVNLGSGMSDSKENTLTQSQILKSGAVETDGRVLQRGRTPDSSTSVVMLQRNPSLSGGHLPNAAIPPLHPIHRRNSERNSLIDSGPNSRKASLGEIGKHQESSSSNIVSNPSPSRVSVTSQTSASFSSRPNNQRHRGETIASNSSDSNLEARRLSKTEMDDIDKIMKEFITDIEKKQPVTYDANRSDMPYYKQQQQNGVHQMQQPERNICQRSTSLLVRQPSLPPPLPPASYHHHQHHHKMIMNITNLRNGPRVSREELLQPAVEASIPAPVKNAPRVALSQMMYSSPSRNSWHEPLRSSQGASGKTPLAPPPIFIAKLPNDFTDLETTKNGFNRGRSPPPFPIPRQESSLTNGNLPPVPNSTAASAFTPRVFVNGCQPPAISRPVSLYSGGRPGNSSSSSVHSQHLRPLPSYSNKPHPSYPKGFGQIPQQRNQTKRHSAFVASPLRHSRSLENFLKEIEDRNPNNSRSGSPSAARPGGRASFRGQGLVPSDNISLSSYSGSEMSRSDPTLSYDSASAVESEYDNYRPGMASDEDYFVLEPISDIDLDMFDDINVDNVEVSENYNSSYIPMLQKMITDV